jgi:hypothetical protein
MNGKTYDIQKITKVEGIDFSDENLYHSSDMESGQYYKPWGGYGIYQPPTLTTPHG